MDLIERYRGNASVLGGVFAAMKTSPRHGDKRLVEACGRVRLSTGDEFCVGAARATNNTGEMQGLIEALSWPNSCVEQGVLQACSALMTTVDSRSTPRDSWMTRSWQKENILLATLLRHMWCLTKKRPQLHFRWLRSSTGDVRNIIADRLADCGTQPALQLPWWRRTPNGGWEEEAFVVKIVSFQSETTPCAGAFLDMCPGPVDVARSASPVAKKAAIKRWVPRNEETPTLLHTILQWWSCGKWPERACPQSLSSYPQETGGPSVQDSNEIGSTIAFEPREVLQSVPRVDRKRVREVTFVFGQRATCAEDHLVKESPSKLDEDIWETLAKCFSSDC